MKKKLLSVLLCAAMAVSMMAGCGSETTADPTEAPTATTAPTEAPEPTAAPTAEPTEAPAVTGEALPEAVYYFPFDDATGLSPRMNGAGTNMDERVYPVEEEFIFTNGVKGNCLWLDGTFGAQVDGIEPLNKETYTISFWTWAARRSNYATTLQFGNGMATGATEHWLSFTSLDAANSWPCIWSRWQPETGNVQPFPYYEEGTVYGMKKWVHVALVVDETETVENSGAVILQAQLYINGVPSDNDILVVPGVFTGDKATTDWRFLIGVNPWDSIMKGCMDELYIFDEALTPGQILTLYADGDGTSVPEQSTVPEPEVIRDYSAVTASGTIVGATDSTSKYGDVYSEIVEIPVGETVAVKFKNYIGSKLNADGKNIYDFGDTFSLILQNVAEGHSTTDNAEYKEYAVISGSEGYEAAAKKSDLNVTRNTFNQFNPEKFTMDSDQANYTVAITNLGTTAKVAIKASCADTIIRYIDIEEIAVDGPLYYCLTTQGSFIDIAAADEAYGQIVGKTDCTTPWWTTFSDTIKVEPGKTEKIHIKNFSSGANNWNNVCVVLQNMADAHSADPASTLKNDPNYAEYAVVRSDNYGWGVGYDNIVTPECTWNWDTFMADINGADVIIEVTNNDGATADVLITATSKAGVVNTQKYNGIAITGDLYYCLVVDNSYFEIKGTPVGTPDCAAAWWTTFSDTVKVEPGTTESVYFKNYSSGANNWNNFCVVLQNMADAHTADTANVSLKSDANYAEYAVVRSDNYGWGPGYEGKVTPECTWNWDTFLSDINGADVVLDITNNGTTADVVATVTTKVGTVYTQKYMGIEITGDLYYCLVMDGSFVDIVGKTVGPKDCSAAWWTTFSDTIKVEPGTTEYMTFRNYSSGANNWNNFCVVLQNMADAHTADTANVSLKSDANYAEYAVVRSDNYGWGPGYEGKVTPECDWNWDTFISDINGAQVDLAVTNNGTTADVVATVTTKNGDVYTQKYMGIEITGDLYYCLVMDASHVVIFE